MDEIIPLKQDRFTSHLGQGVGEAIPKVQTGRVPAALSEITVGFSSNPRLSFGHRFGYELSLPTKIVKPPARDRISAPINHNGCFDVIDGRNAAAVRVDGTPDRVAARPCRVDELANSHFSGNTGGRGKSVGGIASKKASFGFWQAQAGQSRPVQWPRQAPSRRCRLHFGWSGGTLSSGPELILEIPAYAL